MSNSQWIIQVYKLVSIFALKNYLQADYNFLSSTYFTNISFYTIVAQVATAE